jgi:hypothetical protein
MECAEQDNVIDFLPKRQERYTKTPETQIAEFAMCNIEKAFARCDWKAFAYWHRIYCRARAKR